MFYDNVTRVWEYGGANDAVLSVFPYVSNEVSSRPRSILVRWNQHYRGFLLALYFFEGTNGEEKQGENLKKPNGEIL